MRVRRLSIPYSGETTAELFRTVRLEYSEEFGLCGLPPRNIFIDEMERVVQTGLPGLAESHFQRDELPHFRKVGFCRHLVRKTDDPGRDLIKLVNTSSGTFDNTPYPVCSGELGTGIGRFDSKIVYAYNPWLFLDCPEFTSHFLEADPLLAIDTPEFDEMLASIEYRAWSFFVPRIEGQFNLPVFIAELIESWRMIVSLCRHLFKFVKALAAVLVQNARDKRVLHNSYINGRTLESVNASHRQYDLLRDFWRSVREFFGQPLDTLNNSYLATVLGWKPLVSAIKDLFSVFTKAHAKVERFLRGEGKTRTLHYKRDLRPQDFLGGGTERAYSREVQVLITTSGLFPTAPEWEPLVKEIKQPFGVTWSNEGMEFLGHSAIRFRYHLEAAEELKSILAFMDAYKVNLSASSVWELVPLSFVIDWFFDVGGWIARNWDIPNIPVTVVIEDASISVEYSVKTFVQAKLPVSFIAASGGDLMDPDSGFVPSIPPQASSQMLRGYYRRQSLFVPVLDKQWGLRLPKGWQIVTAASLALSKGRSARRRRRGKLRPSG